MIVIAAAKGNNTYFVQLKKNIQNTTPARDLTGSYCFVPRCFLDEPIALPTVWKVNVRSVLWA